MTNLKIALGFIGGIAAGFVVATLVSPEKGSVLRGKIAESVNGLGECIRESLLDLIGESTVQDAETAEERTAIPPVGPHAMG